VRYPVGHMLSTRLVEVVQMPNLLSCEMVAERSFLLRLISNFHIYLLYITMI